MESAKNLKVNVQNNFQTIDETNTSVTINLELQNLEIDNAAKSQIIFVIDKSGSMSGKYMQVTKEFLQVSLPNIIENNFKYITIIPFNNDSKLLPINFENKTKEEVKKKIVEFIETLKAGGGTIFHKTFTAINECIEKQGGKGKNVFVLYLTDGDLVDKEDSGNNYQKLNEEIDKLKKTIKIYTNSCEFHTIGVNKDHDPVLLENLTNLSTGKGTYQYLEKIEDSQRIFENISMLLEGYFGTLKAKLEVVLENRKEEIDIDFSMDSGVSNQLIFESLSVLKFNSDELKSAKMFLKIKEWKEEQIIEIKPTFNEIDPITKLSIEFHILTKAVNEILDKAKLNINEFENLDSCNEEFTKIRLKFADKIKKIYNFPPSKRDPLFEKASNLQEFMNSFEKFLNAAYKKNISKNDISEVNAMAYKGIIDNKINKKLEKRAQKTVKIINEAYQKIEDYAKTLDKEILAKKYKEEEVNNFGTCFLSCFNYLECILDGDCLCITYNVSRTELSIVNSSSLKINQIFPTYISAQGFLSTVKYALKLSPEAGGGFDIEKKGKIVKGVAQEDINGCLPMYICPEHWEVARLMMKPILGWVTTLDPVGYSYEQKKNVPFLLFAEVALKKLDKSTNNEFWEKMFDMLFETCQHLLIDDDENPELEHTWKPEFKEIFNNYLLKGENRTPDSVPSNKVYLMQIFCAMKIGWINPFDKAELEDFFVAMLEEELRRNQIESNTKLCTLLDIPNEKIKEFGDNIIDQITKSAKEINPDTVIDKNTQIVKYPKTEFDLQSFFNEKHLSNKLLEARKTLETHLKTFCYELLILKRIFTGDYEPIEPNLKLIRADDNIKVYALYLQNLAQIRNGERKKAFKYGKYKPYYIKEQAQILLNELILDAYVEESDSLVQWKRKEHSLKNREQALKYKKEMAVGGGNRLAMLNELCLTEDMKNAVDIFKKLGKTSRLFYFYWFKRNGGPKLFEKLSILMTGKYLNEEVFHVWTYPDFYPKGKVLKKIIKQNPSFNVLEWKKAFA